MKNRVTLALVLCVFTTLVQAQFYKSVLPSPGFTNALEKIVLDFRLDYKTIQGEQISRESEVESYLSGVALPGAKGCTISRFHSKQDTTASWQAVMYEGDSYADAVKEYKNVVRLVKKSQMRWIDRSVVHFVGEMEEPSEEVGFAVTILGLDVADKRYTHFVAEIELSGSEAEWSVRVNLHKKRDDRDM
ncbi:hypothetical protein SAMN05421788_103455 [Filimonas lacunae]|uniref:Uncharacterized protein n=1 Tax=Filimonas lacunae TaxID=477680 RepID=A0A1N7PGY1_9BACT|nr:hypothetical protein [Filimonas lacunae]SIT09589.1 hypothetical protein SAMN05421788_103455 [Filimonas lacunae]